MAEQAGRPQWAYHAPQNATEAPRIEGDTTKADEALQNATAATSGHAEGSATIKAGDNMYLVQHGLGVTPAAITLHGIPDGVFSYIVGQSATSFQVNLESAAQADMPFTWEADT